MVFILYDKNECSWYQLVLPPIFSFLPVLPAGLVCVIKWMQEPVVTLSDFAEGCSCLVVFHGIYVIGPFPNQTFP